MLYLTIKQYNLPFKKPYFTGPRGLLTFMTVLQPMTEAQVYSNSIVVENFPHHPKVKGASTTAA